MNVGSQAPPRANVTSIIKNELTHKLNAIRIENRCWEVSNGLLKIKKKVSHYSI